MVRESTAQTEFLFPITGARCRIGVILIEKFLPS